MAEPLVVPRRFNGPKESGNGGYCAGAIAGYLGGAAEVSLRQPVPLEKPLAVEADGDSAQVLDDERLIAEGVRKPDFELEVPEPVGAEDAREASGRYRGLADGPFSSCFVCGRARADGLGVFAGAVEGRNVVASPWRPPAWTADAQGAVRPEIVWGALDCPTYFAAHLDDELTISFLVRMSGRIHTPVEVEEEQVVIAWPIAAEGRKRSAGSAVLSADGEVRAVGEVLLVEPRG